MSTRVIDLPLIHLNDLTVDGWSDWLEAVLLGERPSGIAFPPDSEPHAIIAYVFDAVPNRTKNRLADSLSGILESTVAEPRWAAHEAGGPQDQVSTSVLYSTLQAVAKVRPRKAKQRVQRLLFDRTFVEIVHNKVIDLDLFLLAVVGEYDVDRNVRDWLLEQRELSTLVGDRDLIALRLLVKRGGYTWLQYLEAVLRNCSSDEFLIKLVFQLKAILHRYGYMPFSHWVTRVCTFPGDVLPPALLRCFAEQFHRVICCRSGSLGSAPPGLQIAATQLQSIFEPLPAKTTLELASLSGLRYKRRTERALENIWRWRIVDLRADRIAEKPWEVNSRNARPYVLTERDGLELEPERTKAAERLLKLEGRFQRAYGPRPGESVRRLLEGS